MTLLLRLLSRAPALAGMLAVLLLLSAPLLATTPRHGHHAKRHHRYHRHHRHHPVGQRHVLRPRINVGSGPMPPR